MHRLNISYKQFYVTLNEIWLFESDPNAPSTWSERGGKQWQRSIRGRRNWDVELGPCAVIRHLCSVAFVWETKRPQADNSRSLIDRQVSCLYRSLESLDTQLEISCLLLQVKNSHYSSLSVNFAIFVCLYITLLALQCCIFIWTPATVIH